MEKTFHFKETSQSLLSSGSYNVHSLGVENVGDLVSQFLEHRLEPPGFVRNIVDLWIDLETNAKK